MEQHDELRVERDALESQLLTLELAIQGCWQRDGAAPVDLLECVEVLLRQLRTVNSKLSDLRRAVT